MLSESGNEEDSQYPDDTLPPVIRKESIEDYYDVSWMHRLGSSHYDKVVLGINKKTKQECAIKYMLYSPFSRHEIYMSHYLTQHCPDAAVNLLDCFDNLLYLEDPAAAQLRKAAARQNHQQQQVHQTSQPLLQPSIAHSAMAAPPIQNGAVSTTSATTNTTTTSSTSLINKPDTPTTTSPTGSRNTARRIPRGKRFHILVLEWMNRGSLLSYINAMKTQYTEQAICIIVGKVARALSKFHSLDIAHRDIKPENILVRTMTAEELAIMQQQQAESDNQGHGDLGINGEVAAPMPQTAPQQPQQQVATVPQGKCKLKRNEGPAMDCDDDDDDDDDDNDDGDGDGDSHEALSRTNESAVESKPRSFTTQSEDTDTSADTDALLSLTLERPENVVVKLSDFGFAHFDTGHSMNSECGTPEYQAPETQIDSKTLSRLGFYNKKCDVWSLGALLYVLLSGTFPFRTLDPMAKVMQDYTFPESCFGDVSKRATSFVNTLMCPPPRLRPSINTVTEHAWLLFPEDRPATHELKSRAQLSHLPNPQSVHETDTVSTVLPDPAKAIRKQNSRTNVLPSTRIATSHLPNIAAQKALAKPPSVGRSASNTSLKPTQQHLQIPANSTSHINTNSGKRPASSRMQNLCFSTNPSKRDAAISHTPSYVVTEVYSTLHLPDDGDGDMDAAHDTSVGSVSNNDIVLEDDAAVAASFSTQVPSWYW